MIRQLVLTAALAAAAFAQPPHRMGGRPGETKALAEYLGLSDDQVTRLRNINRDAMKQAQPSRDQMREKARALRQAMDAANPDPAAVGRATIEMQQLRKTERESMNQVRQESLNVLTTEQRTKLAALENARKLQPAIGEAMMLHLLAPPDGAEGPGFGFAPFGRGRPGPPRDR